MIRPFSRRHRKALLDKTISVSLSKRLRRRIFRILSEYDHAFFKHDTFTSIQDKVVKELKKIYGVDDLEAFTEDNKREPVDLFGFVLGAYPAQVLDVVEICYQMLADARDQLSLQAEINAAFEDEDTPWRMCDGMFIKLDSGFMEAQVLARAEQLMLAEGFEGAIDEFISARNNLVAGDYKGAILDACKSFESVLKTVLKREDGNASVLIREFADSGFLDDLPESYRRSFAETVLNGLPYLRNRLAGHGQGEDIIAVGKPYAQLALHLAGALILFVVEKYLESKPSGCQTLEPLADDEVPF